MIFRPTYCSNCGERIERKEWYLWTSRRFCQVCESEYKGQDLIPRVVVVVGTLATIIGFGSYLKSGTSAADPLMARQTRNAVERPSPPAAGNVATVPQTAANENDAAALAAKNANVAQSIPRSFAALPPKANSSAKDDSNAGMYYCGAQTKKGTPCTRRVKGNIRCFQHMGMPAMLPPDKLKVG